MFYRQNWLDYCLINFFDKHGYFMPDDKFSETIIIFNKYKIKLSANLKFNIFLTEMMVLNILLLYRVKKVLLQIVRVTSHGSYHIIVKKHVDILFLIKHLMESFIFKKSLDCSFNKEN